MLQRQRHGEWGCMEKGMGGLNQSFNNRTRAVKALRGRRDSRATSTTQSSSRCRRGQTGSWPEYADLRHVHHHVSTFKVLSSRAAPQKKEASHYHHLSHMYVVSTHSVFVSPVRPQRARTRESVRVRVRARVRAECAIEPPFPHGAAKKTQQIYKLNHTINADTPQCVSPPGCPLAVFGRSDSRPKRRCCWRMPSDSEADETSNGSALRGEKGSYLCQLPCNIAGARGPALAALFIRRSGQPRESDQPEVSIAGASACGGRPSIALAHAWRA